MTFSRRMGLKKKSFSIILSPIDDYHRIRLLIVAKSLFSGCIPAHAGRVTYISQTVIFQKLTFARHNKPIFHGCIPQKPHSNYYFVHLSPYRLVCSPSRKISASAGHTEVSVFPKATA